MKKSVRIVNFPLQSDDTFMLYNMHRKTSVKNNQYMIITPLLGQNCTMTSKCYIDFRDIKNIQQSFYFCKQCNRKSDIFLLDVGYKKFLHKLAKTSRPQILARCQLKINLNQNKYRLILKLDGIIGLITNQFINSNGQKQYKQILADQEYHNVNYQKVLNFVKEKIVSINETFINRSNLKPYSWCRYYENGQSYLLLFFRNYINPFKVKLVFEILPGTNTENNNLSKKVAQRSKLYGSMNYYHQQGSFIIVIASKLNTLYFSSFIDQKYGLFDVQNKILKFQLFYKQDYIRYYPSLWINQKTGIGYVVGGFDISQPQKIPSKIIEFKIQPNRKIQVKKTINLFKPVKQINNLSEKNKIGIRGTNLLRYFTFRDLRQKTKSVIPKSQQIVWYSFGGSYCQTDRFSDLKIVSQLPGIRSIQYKIKKPLKNNNKKISQGFQKEYIDYNDNCDQKVVQQCGTKKIVFLTDKPFLVQIPIIMNSQMSLTNQNNLNSVIIFKGQQGKKKTICKYDIEKSQIKQIYKNIKFASKYIQDMEFPFQQIENYADNNCSILCNQKGQFYLRMSYPCKNKTESGNGRYLAVEYNIQKNQFFCQMNQIFVTKD